MRNFVVCTYLIQAVCALIGRAIFVYVVPQYAFALYWAVPALFMLLSLLAAVALQATAHKSSQQAVNWIFGAKIVKFIVAIACFVAYIKVMNEQNVAFACVFLSFYTITLIVETLYFSKLLKSKHV